MNRRRRNKNKTGRRRPSNITRQIQSVSVRPDVPFLFRGRADPTKLTINSASSTYTSTTPITFDVYTKMSTPTDTVVAAMQEWSIRKVIAKIIPLSATLGSTAFGYTMDATVGTPSSWVAGARILTLPNTNQGTEKYHTLIWEAKSYDDLSFSPTSGTIAQPVSFFWYTNTTDFGTPTQASTVDVFRIEFDITIALRGLGNG